jgi:hypothetical protein
MPRLRAQLILLISVLVLAHAQCVLACAMDDCRPVSVPPCHRHHPVKNCNQDHFVSAQPPVVKMAPSVMTAVPAADVAAMASASIAAVEPPFSPPPSSFVQIVTPLRV